MGCVCVCECVFYVAVIELVGVHPLTSLFIYYATMASCKFVNFVASYDSAGGKYGAETIDEQKKHTLHTAWNP